MKLGQRGPDEEDEGKGNSYLFIAWTGIVLDALGGGVFYYLAFPESSMVKGKAQLSRYPILVESQISREMEALAQDSGSHLLAQPAKIRKTSP